MTRQITVAPGEYSIVLPGTWAQIPLTSERDATMRITALVKKQVGRNDRLARHRREVRDQLVDVARKVIAGDAPHAQPVRSLGDDDRAGVDGEGLEGAGIGVRQEIKRDRQILAPIGRHLQNSWSRYAFMREQQVFAELGPATRRHRIDVDAGRKLNGAELFGGNFQRHQARPRLGYPQSELARDIISPARSPHFWNGQAARRQHKCRGFEHAVRGLDVIVIAARNFAHANPHAHLSRS